ncbi:MAG TPA: ATPase domain-containing protein, partial [Vicinamibacteria bacterium]
MTKVSKLPTGVPGLDIITHGGIPEGRSVLVTGRSGTGKTILALQIAANLSRQGVKTILLAVEESPDDLILTGDGLGMDLSGAIKEGSLRVSDASRPMEGPMVVSGEYDISGLIHRVRAIVKQTGARAVVLDSATALFSPRPPQELLRSLFFQLIHSFRSMELTSVVVAEASEDYGRLTTLGVEDYVCDMVIIQRNVVDGERRRRSLEVNKYRRSAHHKGEFPCTITSRGLTIFPLDARERPEDSEVRR